MVQPVGDVRAGDLFVGVGVRHELGVRFPLSGLAGDRTALGDLRLGLGLGPRAVLEIRGPIRQTLAIDERGIASVPLDGDASDGRAADAGDFELSVSFLPIGDERGLAAGGHLAVKLPNTDESKGIGPNTTDVTLAALLAWGADRWRATGWIGVGILEAPLESFEQNDVLAFAFEWSWDPHERLRLAVGARGRASTRDLVPLGTEDAGEAVLRAELAVGRARFDLGLGHGLVRDSGDWRAELGVGWSLARGRSHGHRGPARAHPVPRTPTRLRSMTPR
ncbi:MAG: hypothetical protein MJB57_02610 [Gemmatimonadetes bacterium]|nr:hypothetical protein [Gemmatimonadota bacterium]